jgi:hypothetical protein
MPAVAPPSAAKAEPTALVELFTSEGCSSCPPADRNLSRIARDAKQTGRRVVALSFHVDYWNYLGWRDPFSAARYSARQRQHARALGSGVYTPQMVVNGSAELLGSDEDGADAAIARALRDKPTASIELTPRWDGRHVALAFHARAASDARVCFALAEGAHDVHVLRGENGGSTLSHDNVVRAFECRAFAPEGSVSFELPDGVAAERALSVGWVEGARGRVLGVSAIGG